MTAAVPDPRFRDQLAEGLDNIAARLQPRLDESDAEWVMSTFIAPLFGDGDAADLAEVLAKHRSLPLRISWAAYPGCSCGWLYPADSHGGERLAAFEQHRANALLPVVEARVQAANQLAAEFHRAENAEERGEGICRTCLAPIWNEGGTVRHIKRAEGWSDRIERGGDSLVCFKAIGYRHVPLTGREAAIYDRAAALTSPATAPQTGGGQ